MAESQKKRRSIGEAVALASGTGALKKPSGGSAAMKTAADSSSEEEDANLKR